MKINIKEFINYIYDYIGVEHYPDMYNFKKVSKFERDYTIPVTFDDISYKNNLIEYDIFLIVTLNFSKENDTVSFKSFITYTFSNIIYRLSESNIRDIIKIDSGRYRIGQGNSCKDLEKYIDILLGSDFNTKLINKIKDNVSKTINQSSKGTVRLPKRDELIIANTKKFYSLTLYQIHNVLSSRTKEDTIEVIGELEKSGYISSYPNLPKYKGLESNIGKNDFIFLTQKAEQYIKNNNIEYINI